MQGKAMTMRWPSAVADLMDMLPELRVVVAGLSGWAMWEVIAHSLAPIWIGGPLDPSGLVRLALDIENRQLATAVHVVTAVLLFPTCYALLFRPFVRRFVPVLSHWPGDLMFGAGLWVTAMVGVAHGLAGLPMFLDGNDVAWASLVGHLCYGLAVGGALRGLDMMLAPHPPLFP